MKFGPRSIALKELPLPQWVPGARLKAKLLLLVADFQPEFDELDAGCDDVFLDTGADLQKALATWTRHSRQTCGPSHQRVMNHAADKPILGGALQRKLIDRGHARRWLFFTSHSTEDTIDFVFIGPVQLEELTRVTKGGSNVNVT